MSIIFIAAVELITLYMIDGRMVQVNPKQITHLVSEHPDGQNRVLVEGVHCVVRFTDGSFVSVTQDCNEIRELMEGEGR